MAWKYDEYQTYYGIYEIKKHDICSSEDKPILREGWFNTEQEAKECLDKYYNGGNKKRYDNDFYGWHYDYWYVIYAWNDSLGHSPGFYDMNDYVKDLIDSGEWYNMTKEQRSIITACSPMSAQLRILFERK